MSLDYNLNKITNSGSVCFQHDGMMRVDTFNLIWATLAVDLGKITKANIPEWMVRLRMLATVDSENGIWDTISEEVLTIHIGLSTNVRSCTRAQFKKKIITTVERNALNRVRDERRNPAPTVVQVG